MLYIVHVYHFWVCVCQTKLLLKSRLSSHMELSLARFLTDHYHVITFLVPSVQYNKTRNENKHYWPQILLPENWAEIKTVIYWFCRSERTMNWPCCQDFSITQGSQFLWVNAGIYIILASIKPLWELHVGGPAISGCGLGGVWYYLPNSLLCFVVGMVDQTRVEKMPWQKLTKLHYKPLHCRILSLLWMVISKNFVKICIEIAGNRLRVMYHSFWISVRRFTLI